MDPPSALLCELRPYQKQALHWMNQLEKGRYLEDAATTLHPCWDAYHLEDKYGFETKKLILNFFVYSMFVNNDLYPGGISQCM